MNLDLAGQVAVVAGAAQGIGQAIAAAFAAEGAHLALLDRDPKVAGTAADLAARYTVPVQGFVADVEDYESVSKAAEHVQTDAGEADGCDSVVVNRNHYGNMIRAGSG